MNLRGEVLGSLRRKLQREMKGIHGHTGLYLSAHFSKENFLNLVTPGSVLVSSAGALLVILVMCCREAHCH